MKPLTIAEEFSLNHHLEYYKQKLEFYKIIESIENDKDEDFTPKEIYMDLPSALLCDSIEELLKSTENLLRRK